MSTVFNIVVFACIILMAIFLIFDIVRGSRMRGVIGLIVLACVVILLWLTTDFEFTAPESIAFGGTPFGGTFPTMLAIALMFGCIILGMLGHYVWQKPEKFSVLEMLRPLVASPIVLLPLIGSLDGSALQPVQLVSLILLAFQNGFFWPRVLSDAKPTT